jgi:hypothetical protein
MIQFTERVVAFIDVLGFKALVDKAVVHPPSLSALDGLVSLLGAAIPFLDGGVQRTVPTDLIPKHLYVSDCIILSAPVATTHPGSSNYNGLEIVAMRVIQVTQLLLDLGFLVRGGIAIGPLWHIGTNIVGPAYQEVLELEKSASMPRVILSKQAESTWEMSRRQGNQMCIDYDRTLMVNGLHSAYIPKRFGPDISAAYGRYAAVIAENLGAGHVSTVSAKWAWMQKYVLWSQQ